MSRKQRIWLIAGATTLLLTVFCCAASISAFVWLTVDDAEETVDDYLTAIQDGDRGEARELLCETWRENELVNSSAVTNWADIIDWDITDSETHDKSAVVTARVTYRVFSMTESGSLRFTLVREDGDWRVCGIRPDAG